MSASPHRLAFFSDVAQQRQWVPGMAIRVRRLLRCRIREIHRLTLRLRHNGGEVNFTNQLQKEENIAQAAYTGQ
ncbi:Uncharacterised protein [Citrobacter koseri]|nr:Uncharacterised protein [Citrobacter koseri]STT20216.1 Uncharacterised protein [Citrobacter koseri]